MDLTKIHSSNINSDNVVDHTDALHIKNLKSDNIKANLVNISDKLNISGINFDGANGYVNGNQEISVSFPINHETAGVIFATHGHYGAGGYQCVKAAQFYTNPYFAEYPFNESTTTNQGTWSFSWTLSGGLVVTKTAGTYVGGGPWNILVWWCD